MTGTGDPDTFRCCFRQAAFSRVSYGRSAVPNSVGVEGLGTNPRRAGGFLCGRDDYFCRKETGERGVNDRIRLGKIDFCCENTRFAGVTDYR